LTKKTEKFDQKTENFDQKTENFDQKTANFGVFFYAKLWTAKKKKNQYIPPITNFTPTSKYPFI